MEKLAPLNRKPMAPSVTTALRAPFRAAPTPTNKLAPLTVSASTRASVSVLIVPFPVMTSALAMSKARSVNTATTLPGPISIEPDATTLSRID